MSYKLIDKVLWFLWPVGDNVLLCAILSEFLLILFSHGVEKINFLVQCKSNREQLGIQFLFKRCFLCTNFPTYGIFMSEFSQSIRTFRLVLIRGVTIHWCTDASHVFFCNSRIDMCPPKQFRCDSGFYLRCNTTKPGNQSKRMYEKVVRKHKMDSYIDCWLKNKPC